MRTRRLRGQGPQLPFETLWNTDKDYLGLIVGFHDLGGTTVYGKMTHCREATPGVIYATVLAKDGTTTAHQFPLDAPMRVLTQRKCPWCATMFFPRHQDQRFCEPDHEDAQEAKCQATRRLLQHTCHRIGVTCPCPHKKPYFTQAEALAGAKNARRRYNSHLQAYLCVCDRWHLGHPNKTPEWIGSGIISPSVPRIAHYLEAHGIKTNTPGFQSAAEEALAQYWDEAPPVPVAP